MNIGGEKRAGTRREKSPSITKITKEMNEQIIVIYVWKLVEKVTYVWEINLSLTMMYADSVSFLTSTDDRIQ